MAELEEDNILNTNRLLALGQTPEGRKIYGVSDCFNKKPEIKINYVVMTQLEFDFNNKNGNIINGQYHGFPVKIVTKI